MRLNICQRKDMDPLNKMEEKLKKLQEKVDFMYDLLKIYCVIQLDENLFKEWKEKKGVFRSRKLD